METTAPKKKFRFRPGQIKRAAKIALYSIVAIMMVVSMVSPALMF